MHKPAYIGNPFIENVKLFRAFRAFHPGAALAFSAAKISKGADKEITLKIHFGPSINFVEGFLGPPRDIHTSPACWVH